MDSFILYIILKADSIINAAGVALIASILAFIIAALWYCVSRFSESGKRQQIAPSKRLLITSILCVALSTFFAVFTPTTKEAAVLYVLPKAANNEAIREIPKRLLKIADKWLESITPTPNKEQ